MTAKLHREAGSFILVLMLLLATVSLVGGVYYFVRGSAPATVAADPRDAFERIRGQAEKALAAPEAVTYSVSRNPNSFSCLYSSTAECAGKGGLFLFYEEVNSQPLSQLEKTAGLTADGLGCRGFPSLACPLRVESSWVPVCGTAGRCENTKSVRVKINIVYNDGAGSGLDWNKDALFTPVLQLSQNVVCERGGGVWANTECLTPDQAAQRNIASTKPAGTADAPPASEPVPATSPDNPEQFVCPQQIAVQGTFYPIDFITAGRGQVKVPAMNGCQTEDTFIFQCNRKEPAQFEGEGQWVQVEAIMAGADCQTPITNGAGGDEAYSRR